MKKVWRNNGLNRNILGQVRFNQRMAWRKEGLRKGRFYEGKIGIDKDLNRGSVEVRKDEEKKICRKEGWQGERLRRKKGLNR